MYVVGRSVVATADEASVAPITAAFDIHNKEAIILKCYVLILEHDFTPKGNQTVTNYCRLLTDSQKKNT